MTRMRESRERTVSSRQESPGMPGIGVSAAAPCGRTDQAMPN